MCSEAGPYKEKCIHLFPNVEVIDGNLDGSDDVNPDLLVAEDLLLLLVGFLMLVNNDSIQQVVKADVIPVNPVLSFFWK